MNCPRIGAGDISTINAGPTPNRQTHRAAVSPRKGNAIHALGASSNGVAHSGRTMLAMIATRRLPLATPRRRQYSPSQLAMSTPSGELTHMISPITVPALA
ncbi:hypothetical protein D3C81_1956750 [compost metagenome]